jgi:hypothetical protein
VIAWWTALDGFMRRVVAVTLTVLLLVVIVLALSWCSEMRRADESDAQSTMANSRTAAAADSSAIRDRAETRTNQINDTVKGATDEVRNSLDPVSRHRAARDGVCRIDPSACAE